MEIKKSDYPELAILLGNGLNNYVAGCIKSIGTQSWGDLLRSLSGEELPAGMLESKALNYPEYFDSISFRNSTRRYYKTLKGEISNKILSWKGTPKHRKLTQFAIENDIPILTTNFDMTLINNDIIEFLNGEQKDKKMKNELKPIINEFHRYSRYLWHSYFSTKRIKDAIKQFGIWHIHGLCCYKQSLNIGAIGYGNSISKYKEVIDSLKKDGYSKWKHKNSWLDIFLNSDLLIIGLGLNSEETSLRWLLMRREELYQDKVLDRKETGFVIAKDGSNISIPKKYFLNSIKIEIVEVDNYKALYSEWSYT